MGLGLTRTSDLSLRPAANEPVRALPVRQPIGGGEMHHLAIVIAEIARLLGGRRIFEFGCSSGQTLLALRAELQFGGADDVLLSGVDLRQGAGSQGHRASGIDILEGNEDRLKDIESDAFDLSYAIASLAHWLDPRSDLSELVRVTKTALILLEPVEQAYIHDYPSVVAEIGAKYVGSIPLGLGGMEGTYCLHIVAKADSLSRIDDTVVQKIADRLEALQTFLRQLERVSAENRKLKSEIELFKLWSAEAARKEAMAAERRVRLSELEHRVGSIILSSRFRVWTWPLVPVKLGIEYVKYRRYRKYAEQWQPRVQRMMRDKLLNELHKPPQKRTLELVESRVCYVLHNSLPYASGGYATRGHGLARGLVSQGFEVIALTRPGFPVDVNDIPPVEVKDHTIDGVHYRRIASPDRKDKTRQLYMLEIIEAFEAAFREIRPSIVIGASFYISAVPAMIAARRLGIPFIYELRGLAEITKISRDPSYRVTPAYEEQVLMETETGQYADHMFTLTRAMRDESIERGVQGEKITILPNSCDPEKFSVMPRDADLAARYGFPEGIPVIGYIGSIVDYEGLDDLIEACAVLKSQGLEFRVMIVGSETATGQPGEVCNQIMATSKRAGLDKWLVMPGRIPHHEVRAHYSLIDIAPFPRKPWPVCEMVSPMKPLEAFAMEKAVVVSSVAALSEMVRDGETGMIFEKGNIASLAGVLEKLIQNKELRERLGRAGRQYVNEERTWTRTANIAADIIRKTIDQNSAEPPAGS